MVEHLSDRRAAGGRCLPSLVVEALLRGQTDSLNRRVCMRYEAGRLGRRTERTSYAKPILPRMATLIPTRRKAYKKSDCAEGLLVIASTLFLTWTCLQRPFGAEDLTQVWSPACQQPNSRTWLDAPGPLAQHDPPTYLYRRRAR